MISLASLLSAETRQSLYTKGLALASAVGLPVTSWHAGDPTRSLYWFLASILGVLEDVVVGFVQSAFLEYVSADPRTYRWLVLLADQQFGYTASVATYAAAASGITLTNNAGGYFDLKARDVSFQNSTTGKTYHNTSAGILSSYTGIGTKPTLTLDLEADEIGTASNSAPGEIDTVVTGLNGVTCSNGVAVNGADAESGASIVAGCKAKRAAMSPNGPADAYNYVVCNSALTGTTGITKARTYGDRTTGDVTVYLGGPSGAVSGADVALALAAVLKWSTPWGITPAVSSASAVTQAVTYELWLYDSIALTGDQVKAAVAAALAAWFAQRPIGGDIKAAVGSGKLYREGIRGAIRAACGAHFVDLAITVPSGDVAITAGQIAALGTVTATAVHFEAAPKVTG